MSENFGLTISKTSNSRSVLWTISSEVAVTVKEEVKVIDWKEKIQKLDGFSLAILPFLYLEWGVKSALKATGLLWTIITIWPLCNT